MTSGKGSLVELSGTALSDAIRTRTVSCVEVMSAYLDQIDKFNPAVNAIVAFGDRALLLKQAAERDAQLARGEWLGWMHGFPQAIKDLDDAAGFTTSLGSLIHKGEVAKGDSIYVERMKRAGSIVIGKTNVPEFGLGAQTYNSVYGTTRNAYDQSLTSGGSSGGAAVAVALRMLPVADGSDYGGSLRNPAAFNNIFALRPGFGRVPTTGVDVMTPSMAVIGPMARTVGDLAMLLSVQAGHDERAPLSLRDNPARFTRSLARDFKGTRVAWLGDFGGAIPFEAGVIAQCESALKVFENLGCIVERVVPDWPVGEIWRNFRLLRSWVLASRLGSYYEDPEARRLLKPETIWEIEEGRRLSGLDVSAALIARSSWYTAMQAFMERHEFVMLPSAQVYPFNATVPWPREIAGVSMDSYHRWFEVVAPATMWGGPVLNVPVGLSQRGLPMGMQVVGRHQDEWGCLQLAQAYDGATGWVARHPPAMLAA